MTLLHACDLIGHRLSLPEALITMNGHLHVIVWARENGCPWDSKTCENAALNGHLDVLKWARENGCPWLGRQHVRNAA